MRLNSSSVCCDWEQTLSVDRAGSCDRRDAALLEYDMKSRQVGPKSASREDWCESRVVRKFSKYRMVAGRDFEQYQNVSRGYRWCVESFFEITGRPLICFGRSDCNWTVLTTDFVYGSILGVPRSFDLTKAFDSSLRQSDSYDLDIPKARFDRVVLKRASDTVEFWTPRGDTSYGFISVLRMYPFEKTSDASTSVSE